MVADKQWGRMAAWPDPEDMPVRPLWDMPPEDLPATPLALFRAGAVERCHAWRRAAEADGWSIRPTYPEHEAVETAWTAERDGFKVQGIARPLGHHGSRLPVATLSIWGPDRLAVPPPPEYGFAAILAAASTCMGCGATGVPTERVAFAGRYCAPCAATERPIQEREGWCD